MALKRECVAGIIVAVGKCRRSLSLSYSKIFEVGGPSPKYLLSEKNTETNEN